MLPLIENKSYRSATKLGNDLDQIARLVILKPRNLDASGEQSLIGGG